MAGPISGKVIQPEFDALKIQISPTRDKLREGAVSNMGHLIAIVALVAAAVVAIFALGGPLGIGIGIACALAGAGLLAKAALQNGRKISEAGKKHAEELKKHLDKTDQEKHKDTIKHSVDYMSVGIFPRFLAKKHLLSDLEVEYVDIHPAKGAIQELKRDIDPKWKMYRAAKKGVEVVGRGISAAGRGIARGCAALKARTGMHHGGAWNPLLFGKES